VVRVMAPDMPFVVDSVLIAAPAAYAFWLLELVKF
jgi:hypothetical protein